MRYLFYSPSESLLFWLPGIPDPSSAQALIFEIQNRVDRFSEISRNSAQNIDTAIVKDSSRYKYTRVYFTRTGRMPEEATLIPLSVNMWTWIER